MGGRRAAAPLCSPALGAAAATFPVPVHTKQRTPPAPTRAVSAAAARRGSRVAQHLLSCTPGTAAHPPVVARRQYTDASTAAHCRAFTPLYIAAAAAAKTADPITAVCMSKPGTALSGGGAPRRLHARRALGCRRAQGQAAAAGAAGAAAGGGMAQALSSAATALARAGLFGAADSGRRGGAVSCALRSTIDRTKASCRASSARRIQYSKVRTPRARSGAMYGGSRRRSVASAEPPPAGRVPLAEAFSLNSFVAPTLKSAGPSAPSAPFAPAASRGQAAAELEDARPTFELPPRPGKRPAAPAVDERATSVRRGADPGADLLGLDAADTWCVCCTRAFARRQRCA